MTAKIPITGNPDADRLLGENPLALLLGMLLDQHMQKEKPTNSVSSCTYAVLTRRRYRVVRAHGRRGEEH